MQHLHRAFRQDLLLAVVHPDAVRGAQPSRRESRVGEVLQIAEAARQSPHEIHFVAVLRRVRVYEDLVALRQVRDRFEQLSRAGHREARRERGAQPSVGGAVPALDQRQALVDRVARPFAEPSRDLAAGVHHALADDGADAGVRERFEHGIGVVHRLHREDRRRARLEQFGGGQAGRRAQRARRVRRFERPDAALQPLEQGHVVRHSAEQRLAEMDVRLHKAGEQVVARAVDHHVPWSARFLADGDDPPVADADRPLEHVEAVVHCQDRGIADECRAAAGAIRCGGQAG